MVFKHVIAFHHRGAHRKAQINLISGQLRGQLMLQLPSLSFWCPLKSNPALRPSPPSPLPHPIVFPTVVCLHPCVVQNLEEDCPLYCKASSLEEDKEDNFVFAA